MKSSGKAELRKVTETDRMMAEIHRMLSSNWVTRAVEERRAKIAREMAPIWERMARGWRRPASQEGHYDAQGLLK